MQKNQNYFFTYYLNSFVWVDQKNNILNFFTTTFPPEKIIKNRWRLQLIKNSLFVFREERGLRVTSQAGEVVRNSRLLRL